MAMGAVAGPTAPGTATGAGPPASQSGPADAVVHDRQWLWALLPTVPVVLLVLRLWLLSHQNLQTMLLFVQNVNPLGLISALVVTLIWAPPAVLLTLRALSALLVVSDGDAAARSASWLARMGARTPNWVVWTAVATAALTWQLRFLPALLMVALVIGGLLIRQRYPDQPLLVRSVGVVFPVVAAVGAYAFVAPAIPRAFSTGEVINGLLLLLPPGLALLLTGPIPRRAARAVTHAAATGVLALSPLLVGVIFLRAPVLPTVALEVAVDAAGRSEPDVVLGQIVAVDDRMTTLLNRDGSVRFVINDTLLSKTLCSTPEEVPVSELDVRGWHVERTVLEWLTPQSVPGRPDPRCQGRPLRPR